MLALTIIAIIAIAIVAKSITIGDTTTLYQMVRLGGVPVGEPQEISGKKQILFALWPIYRFYRYIDQDIITPHEVNNVPANKDMTKKGKSQADDEMVFPSVHLRLYIRVPRVSLYIDKFFREGFFTKENVFGSDPDHIGVLAQHLQSAVQASIIEVYSRHHWQHLYYHPTDYEDEIRKEVIKDKVVKDCGLNAPGSLTVRMTRLELPPKVKEALFKKTITSQELEAFEIKTEGEAAATAKARATLYAADADNPQEAKLDILRSTEKTIIGSEITQAIQGLRS